jgi:hypothetical protein
VTVSFDPRGSVSLVGDGRTLAQATYRTRTVVAGCAQLVTVSPPHTVKGIYRRVRVTCRVRKPLQIEAHPIVPTGSQIIAAERGSDTWLVSAVLKPGAGASRLYVFSKSCRTP